MMNKEVFERILADMNGKGRGGLSKEVSFLRGAASSNGISTESNTKSITEQERETGKPSYDQLLSSP